MPTGSDTKKFTSPFAVPPEDNVTIEQLRGFEGQRVRQAYADASRTFGIQWAGRNYDPSHWSAADPANRALSAANACLYGLAHAAIVSAGYSASLGFIHVGKPLSFVYDIADLYKTEVSIPLAFALAANPPSDMELERAVRLGCRDLFYAKKLMQRIIPDIEEVLGGHPDSGASSEYASGPTQPDDDRSESRSLCRKNDRESA